MMINLPDYEVRIKDNKLTIKAEVKDTYGFNQILEETHDIAIGDSASDGLGDLIVSTLTSMVQSVD